MLELSKSKTDADADDRLLLLHQPRGDGTFGLTAMVVPSKVVIRKVVSRTSKAPGSVSWSVEVLEDAKVRGGDYIEPIHHVDRPAALQIAGAEVFHSRASATTPADWVRVGRDLFAVALAKDGGDIRFAHTSGMSATIVLDGEGHWAHLALEPTVEGTLSSIPVGSTSNYFGPLYVQLHVVAVGMKRLNEPGRRDHQPLTVVDPACFAPEALNDADSIRLIEFEANANILLSTGGVRFQSPAFALDALAWGPEATGFFRLHVRQPVPALPTGMKLVAGTAGGKFKIDLERAHAQAPLSFAAEPAAFDLNFKQKDSALDLTEIWVLDGKDVRHHSLTNWKERKATPAAPENNARVFRLTADAAHAPIDAALFWSKEAVAEGKGGGAVWFDFDWCFPVPDWEPRFNNLPEAQAQIVTVPPEIPINHGK